ncbi:hypothetical protein BGZ99_000193 [Dissophora globulifera]|uniref:Uncharacterized protein n=1 Tax=Dissophora globulifera TaxID=979702 RepID=A0A9P6RSI0_9FUNG|nr:hypothetical protein BGZ99_000193 [Dissophora globulifera]
MEMTQAMSGMMDMLLVTSSIEHDDDTGKPILTIQTQNNSPFPLPNVAGTLRIESNKGEPTGGEVNGASATGEFELKEMQSSIYTQLNDRQRIEEQRSNAIDVLLPGMRCMDIFELSLKQFDSWIIHVEFSLKSPGTGKRLFKRHELGVYLLDQCTIRWSSDDGTKGPDLSYTASMMMAPLRHVLKVPVTEGVSVGMRFSMTPLQEEFNVKGYVSSISDDKRVAELRFWSEELSLPRIQDILQLIQRELEILGEAIPENTII